ncbi:MAG: ERCC4 domain-containing protein, partial [Culicoidibacterales bacterium]
MTSKSKSNKNIKQKVLLTSIVVDDREKQVIPYFEEYTIKVSVGRVTTGDYSIIVRDPENPKKFKPVVIFERKTWKDFADSIKDGRMENNQNLHEFRQKYNCRIIFIVEGQPFPADNRKFRGI